MRSKRKSVGQILDIQRKCTILWYADRKSERNKTMFKFHHMKLNADKTEGKEVHEDFLDLRLTAYRDLKEGLTRVPSPFSEN